MQSQFINLPKGEKLQAIVEGLKNRWGFPQCAGAIDGSHIPVISPFEDTKDYFNRKGSYSIILQAVVDHNSLWVQLCMHTVINRLCFSCCVMQLFICKQVKIIVCHLMNRFTNINVGWPGSATELHPVSPCREWQTVCSSKTVLF